MTAFEVGSAQQANNGHLLISGVHGHWKRVVLNVANVAIATSTEYMHVLMPRRCRYSLDYAAARCHLLTPLLDVGVPLCSAWYDYVHTRVHLVVAVVCVK
jgi:hypothetical protein